MYTQLVVVGGRIRQPCDYAAARLEMLECKKGHTLFISVLLHTWGCVRCGSLTM